MAKPFHRFRRFLSELKRRNVYRVAVAYLAVAFVGLQAARLLVPPTTLPGWADDLLIYLAVFGFPIALVLAWAFEMTADGVRRTPEAEPGTGEDRPQKIGVRAGYRVLVGIGLLAAAVAGGWYLTGGGGGETPEIRERSVAVLPFDVSGSGGGGWREAISSLLSTELDGAAGLRAVSDQAAFTESRAAPSGSSPARAPRPLVVGRGLGARYVVAGEAIQLGEELRLTALIHDVSSGERLDRVTVRGSPEQVTTLADSLTRRVLGVLLDESDASIPGVDLASLTTESNEALKDYLAGVQHARRGEYEEGVERFEEAVARDSTFALAHARLAYYGNWLNHEGAGRHFDRARTLADRLPARDRRLIRARYLYYSVAGKNLVARDSLEALVRDYPRDPAIWADLGEVLLHTPAAPGLPAADSAFRRAVELDPRNVGYHDHAVDLAISVRHDNALAARRIEATPSEEYRRQQGLAHQLVFGSADARRDALAALDTLPMEGSSAWPIAGTLWHPANGAVRESLYRRRLQRRDLPPGGRRALYGNLMSNLFDQGKVGEAIRLFEDPDRPVGGSLEGRIVALLTVDVPVPNSIAVAALDAPEPPEGADLDAIFIHGLRLIERGDASDLDGVLRILGRRADSSNASDGPPGSDAAVWHRELLGYAAWKAGRLREARRLWSESNPAEEFGAVWRGDLHRELGDLQKAEGWYLAAWRMPVAHERLGRLYEKMGRPEDAAAAYRRFVESWENADPELQERVTAARKRLEALTTDEGESGE